MGLWSYRRRGGAATASAHVSISVCRGRDAIFREEISAGNDAWPNCSLLPPGVSGCSLWPESAHGHLPTWAPRPPYGYRADCRCDGSCHFSARQKKQKKSAQLAISCMNYVQSAALECVAACGGRELYFSWERCIAPNTASRHGARGRIRCEAG